jgi:hypothetical protein
VSSLPGLFSFVSHQGKIMLLIHPKVSLASVEVFIKFAANFLETEGSLIEAATEACSEPRRAEAEAFFMENGFDKATVTTQYLEQCAAACGWHKQVLRPRNTFKDMLECIKQYGDGLVTEGELIMAVQMVPHQVVACILYNQLPLPVHRKCSLADWDDAIYGAAEKGTPPKTIWG